jgi:signal peptidase II
MALLAAVGILAAGAHTLRLAHQGRMPGWVPALLVGGAASNLVDRLAFGAVHDFLATPWVVFNLADLAVAAGVGGFVLATLTNSHAPRNKVTARG